MMFNPMTGERVEELLSKMNDPDPNPVQDEVDALLEDPEPVASTDTVLSQDEVDAILGPAPAPPAMKDDADKPRYDLIPPEIITALANIFTYGAKKYAPRNCEQGFDYGRLYAALWRHMIPFWEGQTIDPESGMSHLNHALFNIGMLLVQEKRGTGTDDRPETTRTHALGLGK